MAVHQVSLEFVFATNADLFKIGPLAEEVAAEIASFCGGLGKTGVFAFDGWVHFYMKVTFMAYRRVPRRQMRILTF